MPQQTSLQICIYTSFFKRERQYGAFKAKEISIKGFCHNKQASYRCIHRSLSVSDKMTRLKRKKLSIEGCCQNKQARYTFIPCSLVQSGKKYQSRDNATTNKPDPHVSLVLKAIGNINCRYCRNKQARYACIPRCLSVSDNMTRLKRRNY